MTELDLIQAARTALQNSYAPYSKFCVGAALLTTSGKVYTGCNIENASYSPTICAERTAFFKAISEGEKEFSAIAIVGKDDNGYKTFCSPCGVCRQVMQEFCKPEFKIILGNDTNDFEIHALKELLPLSFSLSE